MPHKTNSPLLISIIIFIISLIYTSMYFVYYHIENDVNIKNHYKTKGLYGFMSIIFFIVVIFALIILPQVLDNFD
jgi:hypothetical protein